MVDQKMTLQELKNIIEQFITDRNWQQFHNPKSLSMAIACEAAELMEHFLWSENSSSVDVLTERREKVLEEVADIAILIMALCNRGNIDLSAAIMDKLEKNRKKYPIEKAYGNARKYDEL